MFAPVRISSDLRVDWSLKAARMPGMCCTRRFQANRLCRLVKYTPGWHVSYGSKCEKLTVSKCSPLYVTERTSMRRAASLMGRSFPVQHLRAGPGQVRCPYLSPTVVD